MAGVPGLVCPECGRDAARERRLAKTRRRWRLAIGACLFIVVGSGLVAFPKASRDGWLSFVPTTLLLVMAPPAGREYTRDSSGYWQISPVIAELKRRDAQHSLTSWQWSWYIRNKGVIVVPDRWVAETPLPVVMHAPAWFDLAQVQVWDATEGDVIASVGLTAYGRSWSGHSVDGYRRLPVPLESSDQVFMHVRVVEQEAALWGVPPWKELWSGTISRDVRVLRDPLAMFEILEGENWDARIRERLDLSLDVRIDAANSRPSVYCNWNMDRSSGSGLEGAAVGFELQLCSGGEVRSTVLVRASNCDDYDGVGSQVRGSAFFYPRRLALMIADDPSSWTLRVVGRPDLAGEDFLQLSAWRGSVEIPIDQIAKIHQ